MSSQKASSRPVALGNIPLNIDPQLAQWLRAVKQALEVRTDQRGNKLDAAPTWRDLIKAGLITESDLGILDAALPDWITSDTAPPPPTGLAVTATGNELTLTWNPANFDMYSHTEVWSAATNNLSAAQRIGSVSGISYTTTALNASKYFWIRHVHMNPNLVSAFNDVNGTALDDSPDAPSVNAEVEGTWFQIWWPTPTSNMSIYSYRLEYWDGAEWQLVDSEFQGNRYRIKPSWGIGIRQFRLRARNIAKQLGAAGEFQLEILPVPVPTFAGYSLFDTALIAALLTLNINEAEAPQFGRGRYLIEWAGGSHTADALSAQLPANFIGARQFTVKQIDARGEASSASNPLEVTIRNPSKPTGVTAQPIGNEVTIKFTPPAVDPQTQLSIFRHRIYISQADPPTLADALSKGPEAEVDTTSYKLSFNAAGTGKVWVSAIDTDDNETELEDSDGVSVTWFRPTDFIAITSNVQTDFAAANVTLTNAKITEDGTLLLPLDPDVTEDDIETANGWTSLASKHAAGYIYDIQQGVLTPSTATIEITIDAGAQISAGIISVLLDSEVLAGTFADTTCKITTASDSGFTTNVQEHDSFSALFTAWRYRKILITVTIADDKALMRVRSVNDNANVKINRLPYTVATVPGGAWAGGNLAPDARIWADYVGGAANAIPGFTGGVTGNTANNVKILMREGPSSEDEPCHVVIDFDVASTAEGGLNVEKNSIVGSDPTDRMWLVGMFVCRAGTESTNFSVNRGVGSTDGNVENVTTGLVPSLGSRAFTSGALSTGGVWNLACLLIHPLGAGASTSGYSGAYTMDGSQVGVMSDGEFTSAESGLTFYHRTNNLTAADGSEVTRRCRPFVMELSDASEAPTVIDYLIRCATKPGARIDLPDGIADVHDIYTGYSEKNIRIWKDPYTDVPNPAFINVFAQDDTTDDYVERTFPLEVIAL